MTYWTIAIYCFCFLASACCAWLLMRSWRRAGTGLFYWSGACFGLLAINNLLAVVRIPALPESDLFVCRSLVTLAALAVLFYGFIWEDG
jgi:Family of unknown function (DUF5985)